MLDFGKKDISLNSSLRVPILSDLVYILNGSLESVVFKMTLLNSESTLFLLNKNP